MWATTEFSRQLLRILQTHTDTGIPVKGKVPRQSVYLSPYLGSLRRVWLTEHSYCINEVTAFHEVLIGLWSNEGNYPGYFLVDLFHRAWLCFCHYSLWSNRFYSRNLPIFRIIGHLASFTVYNKSSFRQRTKFQHFFYHINLSVNHGTGGSTVLSWGVSTVYNMYCHHRKHLTFLCNK